MTPGGVAIDQVSDLTAVVASGRLPEVVGINPPRWRKPTSEDPKTSGETQETPEEAINDAVLDDVAGGAAQKATIAPVKDENTFVSYPATFPKVMSYHEADAADRPGARTVRRLGQRSQIERIARRPATGFTPRPVDAARGCA
jgi:hypothetical protein